MRIDLDAPRPVLWTTLAALWAFCLAGCMGVLYTASREVMLLGGFVARGGPYEIAHPAPTWVWVVPVSILSGVVFIGLHLLAASRAGGFNLLMVLWFGLFGSLGWNFVDMGMNPPPGQGDAWVWVVIGAVFWVMALPVLLAFIGTMLPDLPSMPSSPWGTTPRGTLAYRIAHLIAMPAGAVAGGLLFRMIAGS